MVDHQSEAELLLRQIRELADKLGEHLSQMRREDARVLVNKSSMIHWDASDLLREIRRRDP